MRNQRKFVVRLAAVAACCWIVGWGNSSTAQDESSAVVEQPAPAESPALVPAVPTTPEPAPAPGEELALPANGVTVHKVGAIDYDVTRRARRLFGGSEMVDLTMITQNPADGCFYEIPMCLPACCTGEPTMHSYCGFRGRGVVVYCYECGLEIEVKFRLRGDVEVEYGT
jgi:hypothetical protein